MKKHLNLLFIYMTALCLLGWVMLYSTAFNAEGGHRLQVQATCLGVGLLLAVGLARIDYGWLQRKWVLFALGGIGLLLLSAVFVPGIGATSHGAHRWLRGFGQPSEFAKPMIIILLAGYLARLDEKQSGEFKAGFLLPLLLGVVPAFLIFGEPDWGTALLIGMLTLAMLLVNGARWSHLAGTSALAVALLVPMVAYNRMRLLRIMVFLDPEGHAHGLGWQVWQSLVAIGSGGLWGHFLDGSLHKFGYVPEQQTDFIFSCVGEETGLWGGTLVLLLFLGILLCGLHIIRNARDRFGFFLAAGCATVIVLEASLNIAVATSLIPNKGLALPFMSYGGSSLLAMFVCAGLLGSVAAHSTPDNEPGAPGPRAWSLPVWLQSRLKFLLILAVAMLCT